MTWSSLKSKYENFFKEIDFLKIDIEGADLSLLKSMDLNKLKVKLIMVEASHLNDSDRKKTINFLSSKNFSNLFDNNVNVIFENQNLI